MYTTQLEKLSFNHSIGRPHSCHFSIFDNTPFGHTPYPSQQLGLLRGADTEMLILFFFKSSPQVSNGIIECMCAFYTLATKRKTVTM